MAMKKILFIKPPQRHFSSASAPPMGFLYLSSYVKDKLPKEFEIKLIDMRISSINNFERLRRYIEVYRPDIVGLSCCSDDDYYMRKISFLVKDIKKDTIVVVGGPHPTMYTYEVMSDRNIDFCIIGEGEITFYEFLKKYLLGEKNFEDVKGLVYRRNEEIIINQPREFIEDLDLLPFPDWDLLEIERYSSVRFLSMNVLLKGKRYIGIVTSRGCPYRCAYCHEIFGKKFRKRSKENIIEEIKILKEKYSIDELHVYDDIFNLDKKRLVEICNAIVENNIKINFAFPNGLRGDILDEELILKLKKAGAYMLTFALETASERLQKMINKNINIEKLKKNIIFADKIGLLTKCYNMLGFPTETIEEVNKTIKFNCSLPLCFASFFIVTVQKNTQLYDLVKKNYPNFNVELEANQYYLPHKEYEKFVKLPLKGLQLKAYRKFYLNPKRIIKIITRMPRKIFAIINLHRYFTFYFLGLWRKKH
jgi:radical SAM superfamily enzyme YgiQ (UPF0313 family)